MSITRVQTDLAVFRVDPVSGQTLAAPNVSVTINLRNDDGSNGALATVYATPNTSGTLANPLTTDAIGRIYGWVNEGSYNLNVSGPNVASSTLSWEAVPSSAISLVNSVFGRGGNVTAQAGDYTAAQVTNAADKASASQQTFTGNVSAPILIAASGTTGAPNQARIPGATTSGPPTSGTFATGDVVPDQIGNIWVCTAGGTPGTFTFGPPNASTVYAPTGILGTNTTATTVANQLYVASVNVIWPVTITGIRCRFSTLSGNVLVSLFDNSQNLITSSNSTAIAATFQSNPFTSPHFTLPGRYFIGVQFSAAISTNVQSNWNMVATQTSATFAVPTSITATPAFQNVLIPQMSTY